MERETDGDAEKDAETDREKAINGEIGTDGGRDRYRWGMGAIQMGEESDSDGGKRDRCVQAVLRESRGTEIVVLPSACSCDSFQSTGQADED